MRLNATALESMALRHMRGHQQTLVLAQGQVASGLRIQGAYQDAAGLSIATKLSARLRSSHAASRAMQDGLSMLHLADAGIGDVTATLQRMRELTLRAANSTLTATDRHAIKAELDQLSAGIDGIVDGTHFNTMRILGRAPATTALLPASLSARTPISLYPPVGATSARLLGGVVSLNLNNVTLASRARLDSAAVTLDLGNSQDAERATLSSGAITRDLSSITGPTTASLPGGPVSLNLSNAKAAAAAIMESAAIALTITNTPATTAALQSGPISRSLTLTPATTASLDSQAVILHAGTPQDATAATMLTGPVALNPGATTPVTTARMVSNRIQLGGDPAVLTGDNIQLTGSSTNFGSISINGGSPISLGTYTGTDDRDAAQYLADRLNEGANGLFVASLAPNRKALILTSTAVGAGSTLEVSGASSLTGLSGIPPKTGVDTASTALGFVWINGIRTDLGTVDNATATSQSAAQQIVNRINANASNPVTAALGGDHGDQVILTAKSPGTAGNFTITASSDNGGGNGDVNVANGFVPGMAAAGTNVLTGVTDLGSVTIAGVTTNLGPFTNAGKTSQDLAQHIVALLNANTANKVTASVDGVNNDQIRLTAKTLGTAGNFTIETASNDSNGAISDDGNNGFIAGQTATGTDASAGQTDFGSLVIGGTTVELGLFDNTNQTAADAVQWIIGKINDTAGISVLASAIAGDRIRLTSKTEGAAGNFTISSSTNDSNTSPGDDGSNGFTTGMSGVGQDADYGSTDFGTITIDGTIIALGSFDNNSGDDAAATQWIVDRINASAVPLTATRSGNQITLSADDDGTAGNFTIQASTSVRNGFTAGQTATGTDASAGQTDFGSLVIGGTTVELGLFDNTNQTAADAVEWILGKINDTAGISVLASAIAGDKIRLTSKIEGTAGSFTITSSTNVSNGFTTGMSAAGRGADDGKTDFGSITIGADTLMLGLFDNNGKTAVEAAKWIVDAINDSGLFSVTASHSGDRIELRSDIPGAAGSFTVTTSSDSNGDASDNGSLGIASGTTATGLNENLGQTDFGTITIDGTTIVLGSFDNNSGDDAAATQWIVDRINASAVPLTATRSGNQITLSADDEGTAGNFTIQASTSIRNGFAAGQTATGRDADAGETDFGTIVINGDEVILGPFDNNGKTAADAVQWIIGKINGAGLDTLATVLPGNQIRLAATTLGTSGNFTIDSSTSTYNGFAAGASTPGTNADSGETDFGSIFINGIEVELGTFDNNGKTAVEAAQWIVGKINGAAVPVTAGLSGNRIELTSDIPGAGGSFTVTTNADSNGNFSDDGTHGFSNLATATGANASGGQTDFGSLTINGTPIVLGVLDSASYSNASAAAHLASVITGAGAGVQATVQNGSLVLRSADSETDIVIGAVGADSNGDASDDRAIGFLPGDRATPASASDTSGGRTLVEGITIQLGPDSGETIELKTPLDAYADTLGVDTSDLDVSSPEGAAETLRRIEAALSKAGDIRTSIGATMNRVEHAFAASMSAAGNLSASESRIRDADVAHSILALTRSQIAALSAQAMMKHMSFSRANLLELLA